MINLATALVFSYNTVMNIETIMNIEILKNIGSRIFREIRVRSISTEPLIIGAGGDRTYPIDKLAEEIIISELEKTEIPLTIISEEVGTVKFKGGGMRVLIDPVDGSKNAVSGLPIFSTSIAVASGDTIADIEMGYIINLANGDEFWAERGKGAFLNDLPIKTQDDSEFRIASYETQVPSRDLPMILPLLSKFNRTRCIGSTSLDFAYLSSGAIGLFVCPSPSRSFDFGAGVLIAKEAGAVVSDYSGNPLDRVELELSKTASLLASCNESVHHLALEILHSKSTVKK